MDLQRYSGPAVVAVAFIAILAFAGVNVAAALPFALFLIVCPLMMYFMMRSMNHGGSDKPDDDRSML